MTGLTLDQTDDMSDDDLELSLQGVEEQRGGGEPGRRSSGDPFQWEEGSTGSRDSSVFQVRGFIFLIFFSDVISLKHVFQNSVDESSNSQDRTRSLFTTPQVKPALPCIDLRRFPSLQFTH